MPRRHLTGTGTARKVNKNDVRAACDLVAAGETTIQGGAGMVGLSTRTFNDYMHLFGYEPTGRGHDARWFKPAEAILVTQPAPTPVEVDDIDQDELGALYRRLDQASTFLAEADARLTRLDVVEQELESVRLEHAHCIDRQADLERTIAGLRNDAEYGRAERTRKEQVQRNASRALFDQRIVAVSDHLHPPKEKAS